MLERQWKLEILAWQGHFTTRITTGLTNEAWLPLLCFTTGLFIVATLLFYFNFISKLPSMRYAWPWDVSSRFLYIYFLFWCCFSDLWSVKCVNCLLYQHQMYVNNEHLHEVRFQETYHIQITPDYEDFHVTQ